MQWRKAWEKNWDSIRYCSDACRRQKLDKTALPVRQALLELVRKAGPGKLSDPLEIAQKLWPTDWQGHAEEVRRVVRQLASEGYIELFQEGRRIEELNFKGPIKIRQASDPTA